MDDSVKAGVSLFCSSGIGDLGVRSAGVKVLVASDQDPKRMDLFRRNFPGTVALTGDVSLLRQEIVSTYSNLAPNSPYLVLATPPCQGMSSNGAGTMLSLSRKGLRSALDPRNRLIVPALDIIVELQPKWIVFENVPAMANTLIDADDAGELVNIIDYVHKRLGRNYVGRAQVVDTADYGIPQHRRRLITVFSRTSEAKNFFRLHGSFLPPRTHSAAGGRGLLPWKTLGDAIRGLPPLDGRAGKCAAPGFDGLHVVPVLTDEQYVWVSNTAEGDSAFNNQCTNPDCLFQGNPTHGAERDRTGVNHAKTSTPLYCERCGALLPRPCIRDPRTKQLRLIRGYTSAYKRMRWDEPASTITQNFQYICSDNKIHPSQNRVLSLYEASVLQTIAEYDYSFRVGGQQVSMSLIRDCIGESVPPRLTELICRYIIDIDERKARSLESPRQEQLF